MRILKAVTAVAAAMFLMPVAAHADTASEAEEAVGWEMPEIRAETVQHAAKSLEQAADGAEFKLNVRNINGVPQEVSSYSFWKVCWQAPDAGVTVTEDTWVGVGVTRVHTDCW